MQQAIDFRDESEALYDLLKPLEENDFARQTLFKDWTINDVLGHLHHWNWAADCSLQDGDAFQAWVADAMAEAAAIGIRGVEAKWLDGLCGTELLQAWRAYYLEMSERFEAADPSQRVNWAGARYECAFQHHREVDGNLVTCTGSLRSARCAASGHGSHKECGTAGHQHLRLDIQEPWRKPARRCTSCVADSAVRGKLGMEQR